MANFTDPPVKILKEMFSRADQRSRKALRLVNSQLGKIGQQSVFEVVSVSLTVGDFVHRLQEILKRPDLASHITQVYLNTFDLDERHLDGYDVVSVLELFGFLKDIPRLRSVVLRFHPECPDADLDEAPQDENFRSAVMKEGLPTLAAISQIRDLALREIWIVNETDPEAIAHLNKILARLRSLRLNIANENKGTVGISDYERGNPQVFFSELPSFWLKPALSSLKHPALYSSIYIGFFPKCDFRGLHFPQLKTLTLGNHTFFAILYNASVYTESMDQLQEGEVHSSYKTRWADYFRACKDKLPHLQHFRYGSSPDWWADSTTPFEREGQIAIGFHSESYMDSQVVGTSMDYGDGKPLEPSEDDQSALRELCAKVGVSVALL
ncbi:hypothetical protein BJX76DRAFT_351902 [Aspergillus varians]